MTETDAEYSHAKFHNSARTPSATFGRPCVFKIERIVQLVKGIKVLQILLHFGLDVVYITTGLLSSDVHWSEACSLSLHFRSEGEAASDDCRARGT